MTKAKRLFTLPIILLTATLLGCLGEEEDEQKETAVRAPKLTVPVPATMTGDTTAVTQKTASAADTTDGPQECAGYFDPTVDFMRDGTAMTRFLVGLSQAQTCSIDWIIDSAISHVSDFLNLGVQRIPDATAGEITHFRFDNALDTYSLWLYFADPNQVLPDDPSAIETIYLTWTNGAEGDVSGRFIMANVPENPDDPGAPNRARVDFTRTTATAVNRMYFGFPQDNPSGMSGFRVDVTKTGADAGAVYEAKGLIVLSKQPAWETLPEDTAGAGSFVAAPSLAMVATASGDGQGAAVASLQDVALHFENAINDDGDYEDIEGDNGEYMLGTYQFTVSDRTYFDTTGAITWRNKRVEEAHYVNGGSNTRVSPSIEQSYAWLVTTLDLPPDYFTTTCTELDDADCQAFIQGLYDVGVFDPTAVNSEDPEPSDSRSAVLDDAVTLSSAFPEGEDADTTFIVPSPL